MSAHPDTVRHEALSVAYSRCLDRVDAAYADANASRTIEGRAAARAMARGAHECAGAIYALMSADAGSVAT